MVLCTIISLILIPVIRYNSDGTLADALSTALFVMGSADAEAFCMEHGIKAVLLTVDGEISYLGIDGAEG